jgi:hypothetical protein
LFGCDLSQLVEGTTSSEKRGVKPPPVKAVTGHRAPKRTGQRNLKDFDPFRLQV